HADARFRMRTANCDWGYGTCLPRSVATRRGSEGPMNSGIQAIDDLVAGTGSPIAPGSDPAAVGAIQDLLRGQGFARMPGVRESSRGKYGKNTIKAVRAFRRQQGLPDDTKVDQQTLLQLIQVPASNPIASQAYVTLVLNINFTQIVRLVSLVAIVE